MSPRSDEVTRVVTQMTEIASGIEGDLSDAALTELFGAARTSCERAAATQTAETRMALTNVATALQTWEQVWLRLGREQDFRLAVAREARLWSKRIAVLVPMV